MVVKNSFHLHSLRFFSIPFLLFFILKTGTVSAQAFQVTIKVNAPSNTPPDDTLYIAGNDTSLGEWLPMGTPLKREGNNSWSFSKRYAANTHLEFQITRGTWLRMAIYQPGGYPSNTTLNVQHDTTIILSPVTWNDKMINSITGTVRYHLNMQSERLKFGRDVIVWLPPSYFTDTKKHYPVLYMHDGQNIFDASTCGFGYDWRVDEVADSLIRAKSMKEIIVVGIYNTRDRMLEYNGTSQGKAYADFMVNTLKPFIDSHYRTLPDRNNTAVMGSSMGGLISFYISLWYPEVFSKAGCLSSAFIYDEADIMNQLSTLPKPKLPIDFYLDCGDEGIDKFFVKSSEQVSLWLKEKQVGRTEYHFSPGAPHNEIAWSHRIWQPLIFMFGTKQ